MEEIVSLVIDAFKDSNWPHREYTRDKVFSGLKEAYERPNFFGVYAHTNEGRLVGFALASLEKNREDGAPYCWFWSTAVDPDFRGRKIGAALVQRGIDEACSRGAHFIRLGTLRGEAAHHLLEKQGFEIIDGGDPHSKHIEMRLDLLYASPAAFQFSPNVVVTLPEPESWMAGKAIKLKRLDFEQVKILRNCLSDGFSKAREQGMPADRVTVEIFQRTARPEPDMGLGIQAGNHTITMSVNPDKIKTPGFQNALKRLIPHECNHIVRADHLGISVNTVGDAILSEGFALKAEVLAGFPPADFNKPSSVDAFAAYIERVLPVLDTSREDRAYNYWMFGMKNEGDRPNEAFGGYPLGHAIVANYLTSGHSMDDAMRTPNDQILNHWKSDLVQDGKITSDSILAWAERSFHWVDPSSANFSSNDRSTSFAEDSPPPRDHLIIPLPRVPLWRRVHNANHKESPNQK